MTSSPRPEDDWEKHWGEYSESAALNPAQHYRIRLALASLGLDDANSRVVDIGSGLGDFVVELLRRHPRAHVLGLEYSQAGIDISRAKTHDATFLRRDLLSGNEPPTEYRAWGTHAVCLEVLEHVDSPQTLLVNAAAFLKPGCRLLVTVPGGPISAFDRHIGHRRHFDTAELRRVLTNAGFDVERATTAGFPFHNLYRLVVVIGGRRLVENVSDRWAGSTSAPARALMRVFDLLFRLNISSSPWGWQVLAVARLRDP